MPPSAAMSWPVTQAASFEQNSDTALAMSAGVASRRMDHLLYRLGQRVQHAVLDPARADGVDGDPAGRQGHREVADEHLDRRLRRAHPGPGLPAPVDAARGVGDGQDPPAVAHQLLRLAHADQEGLGLRVHGGVPFVQAHGQRGLVEGADLAARVMDEHVEAAELVLHAPEEPLQLSGLAHVGLSDEAVGAAGPDLLQRGLGRGLVGQVVDRDVDTLVGELQRDPAADAPGAARHQRVLARYRHGVFLPKLPPAGSLHYNGLAPAVDVIARRYAESPGEVFKAASIAQKTAVEVRRVGESVAAEALLRIRALSY